VTCTFPGGRLTASLQAATTYYIAAGNGGSYDACRTKLATVEYFPDVEPPSCSQPVEAPLGTSSFASLLQFPERQVTPPCGGSAWSVHHAAYHRFTAKQDGWYAIQATTLGQTAWRPRLAALAACDSAAVSTLGQTQSGSMLCPGSTDTRYYAATTVWLHSGQSVLIVVGGNSENDEGSGQLHIERIGATLMEGAQPLALGENTYFISRTNPTLPYTGSDCLDTAMNSASRFTFTPEKSGNYRFSFCSSSRQEVVLSDSAELPLDSLVTGSVTCTFPGGRLTASLQAATTYYIAAGNGGSYDACRTKLATVEYLDPCPADLNDDDSVDGKDLAILISGWGTAEADVTNDGNTDGVDLGILLAYWGPCTG
jgi:hypothetical protein